VREALYTWRRNIKRQYYPRAVWAPQAILDNATCELLASVGPIDTLTRLEQLTRLTWHRWEQHSSELFKLLSGLNIPSLIPLANTTSNKRSATMSNSQPATLSKRPRTESTQSATRTIALVTHPAIASVSHFAPPVSTSSSQPIVYPPTPLSQSEFPPLIASTQPYTSTSSAHLFAHPAPSGPSTTKYPPYGVYNSSSFRTPAFNDNNTSSTTQYPTPAMIPSQFASPAFNNNPHLQRSSPFPYLMSPAHQSGMHFPPIPQFQMTQLRHPNSYTAFPPTYQSPPSFAPTPYTSTQDFARQPYRHDTDIIPFESTPIIPSHHIDTLHTDTRGAGIDQYSTSSKFPAASSIQDFK
jgi:hypothetical protein